MQVVSLGEYLHAIAPSCVAAAESGMLTERQLSELVRTMIADPDGPRQSAGMHWIVRYPAQFAKVVANPFRFLVAHIGVDKEIGEVPIVSPEVLRLLGERERELYVRTAYVQNGACNNGWVTAVREAGISSFDIAEIILARLRAAKPAEQSIGSCMVDAYHKFLREGMRASPSGSPSWLAGPGEGIAPWEVFDEPTFHTAVQLCVERAPTSVICVEREQLLTRLSAHDVDCYVDAAAARLTGIGGISDKWKHLSADVQLSLARRMAMEPHEEYRQATFLFTVLLSRPWQEVAELYKELLPKLRQMRDQMCVFRVALALMKTRMHTGTAKTLHRLVVEQVALAGLGYGVVELGRHRGEWQVQVRCADITYVPPRRTHRYIPDEWDEVLFDPSQGRWLNHNTVAVNFYPTTMHNFHDN